LLDLHIVGAREIFGRIEHRFERRRCAGTPLEKRGFARSVLVDGVDLLHLRGAG
jgi:hypothetical protein